MSKWSEADQVNVLQLSLQGLSRAQIIARTGIPSSSVGRFLRVGKPDPRYSEEKVAKDEVEHLRLLAKAKAQLANERGGAGGHSTAGGAEASTSAAPAVKGKGKAREVAAPYTKPAPSRSPPAAAPPIASSSRGFMLPPADAAPLPIASSSNLPPEAAPAPTGAFWPKIIDLIARTLPDFSSTTPPSSARLAAVPASYSTSFGSAPTNNLPEAYSTSFGTQSFAPATFIPSLANPISTPTTSLANPTSVPVPPLPLAPSPPAIDGLGKE